MKNKFKYSSLFNKCIVRASSYNEEDKFISKANLDNLKSFELPDNINLDINIDLIATRFNAAVINRLNRNDDGIATETALAIKDYFIYKPKNIEHNKDKIVGTILNAGWSKFGSNELLSNDEVKDMDEPFNMVLGGIVWRTINQRFTNLLLDSSDETSQRYMSVSASWELLFNEYNLVLGSKNLKDAEIISDEKQIKELEKYLRVNGGRGKLPDGTYIGRLIVGNEAQVLPLGIGYVSDPAAEVSGVDVEDPQLQEQEQEDEDYEEDYDKTSDSKTKINETINTVLQVAASKNVSQLKENKQKNKEIKKNSSKNTETVVINNDKNLISNSKKNMKIKNTSDLLSLLREDAGVSEANINDFVKSEIEKYSEEYETKISKKEVEIAEAQKKIEELQNKSSSSEEKLQEMQSQLKELHDQAVATKKAAAFQERMSSLNEEFELSDEDCQVIASQIQDLDQESYAGWYKMFTTFANNKKKSVLAANKKKLEEEFEAAIAKRLEEEKAAKENKGDNGSSSDDNEEAKQALAAAQVAEDQKISNASSHQNRDEDLKNNWSEAFKGVIKVTA